MSTAFEMVETVWGRTPEEAVAEVCQSGTTSEDKIALAGNRDFFAGKSLDELARKQGVSPVKDIRVFAGGIPNDEDVDELLTELEAMGESATYRDNAIRTRLADFDRQEEKRHRLQEFLDRDSAAWNPDDHPEIDAAGGASAWVRKLRSEAEQGFERRTRKQDKE